MKKLLFLLFFIPLVSFGQEPYLQIKYQKQNFEDYKYIKIESNDYSYDIMSTAVEIFRQKGFLYLENKDINDIKDQCEILTAEIDFRRGNKGWTASVLKLKFIDCNTKIIYKIKTKSTAWGDVDVLRCFQKATSNIPNKGVVY